MASCRHYTVLVVVFVLEVVDLFCDWLFYTQVKDSNEVYIIKHDYLQWIILAVASLGSLTFVFEMINLAKEMFSTMESRVLPDTVSMVSTWVEDVPQIAVALTIALNTQEVVHWIQYVKAVWAVVEVAVRALGQCVYCCKLSDRPNRGMNYFVALSKFIAQTVVLGCSVGIFLRLLKMRY